MKTASKKTLPLLLTIGATFVKPTGVTSLLAISAVVTIFGPDSFGWFFYTR